MKEFSAVVGSSKGYKHFYQSAIHYFERARDNAITVVNSQDGNPSNGTKFNVVNAVYNGGPQTNTVHGITNLAAGEIVLTLTANHNLTGGNKIRIAIDSIIFTCTMDNRATEHAYPRKTDPAAPTPRPSDAKNLGGDIAVSIYSANQLRLNVYPSLSGGFFAPLQMELIASILENSTS